MGHEWLKTHSAGSGPFSLRAWKPNEACTLEANPTTGAAPPVKRVVVRHVPEPATQRLLLEKGDIDIAAQPAAEIWPRSRRNPDLEGRPLPRARSGISA